MVIDGTQVLHWAEIFAAGFFAGGINVIVGAGTLISFPLLVLAGFPPLTATIANTIGIVPGSVSGVVVYRRELRARFSTVRRLLPASILGGITGASLLLHFSAEVFAAVIPWLIGIGTVLVIVGPAIRRRIAGAASRSAQPPARRVDPTAPDVSGAVDPSEAPVFLGRTAMIVSIAGAYLLGTYGGYFSAAQGILLIALLGITTTLGMQDLNAIKNLTVTGVNIIAAVVFMVVAPSAIEWHAVALVAVGSTVGGIVGGRFARRLPASVFRTFVVVVGTITVIVMGFGL